jgi:hypothetical protein
MKRAEEPKGRGEGLEQSAAFGLDSPGVTLLGRAGKLDTKVVRRESLQGRWNSTARCFRETLAAKPACSHAMACVCPALRELSFPHQALNL